MENTHGKIQERPELRPDVRWKQMLQFGRPAFVDRKNPDIVKYAESFGAKGFSIEAADHPAPAPGLGTLTMPNGDNL
jgi:hypothetical protein